MIVKFALKSRNESGLPKEKDLDWNLIMFSPNFKNNSC